MCKMAAILSTLYISAGEMSGVLASCDCVLGLIVSFNRPLDSAQHKTHRIQQQTFVRSFVRYCGQRSSLLWNSVLRPRSVN